MAPTKHPRSKRRGHSPEVPGQLVIRAPAHLLAALDAEAERRRDEQPGVRVTRSDVARSLLLAAVKP